MSCLSPTPFLRTVDQIMSFCFRGRMLVTQETYNSFQGFLVSSFKRSEALQRSGRAGRTSSGKCFRIYSKDFWNQCMPDHVIPEIKRTSLTSVVLTLKCLAIHDVIRYVVDLQVRKCCLADTRLFLRNYLEILYVLKTFESSLGN